MTSQMLAAAALACGALLALQDAPAAQDKGVVVSGTNKKPDPAKRVCKTLAATGSIFTKRTCRTADEWKAEEARTAESQKLLGREENARRSIQCVARANCI